MIGDQLTQRKTQMNEDEAFEEIITLEEESEEDIEILSETNMKKDSSEEEEEIGDQSCKNEFRLNIKDFYNKIISDKAIDDRLTQPIINVPLKFDSVNEYRRILSYNFFIELQENIYLDISHNEDKIPVNKGIIKLKTCPILNHYLSNDFGCYMARFYFPNKESPNNIKENTLIKLLTREITVNGINNKNTKANIFKYDIIGIVRKAKNKNEYIIVIEKKEILNFNVFNRNNIHVLEIEFIYLANFTSQLREFRALMETNISNFPSIINPSYDKEEFNNTLQPLKNSIIINNTNSQKQFNISSQPFGNIQKPFNNSSQPFGIPNDNNNKVNLFLKNLNEKGEETGFNKNQIDIIEHISKMNDGDIFLVQGPPGSGKSQLIKGIVSMLNIQKDNQNILICAPSNVAIDLIYLKLKNENIFDHNLSNVVVKVGRFGYQKQVKKPDKFYNDSIEYTVKDIYKYNIICTTLNSSGSEVLKKFKSDYLIVDEAAQCSELSILIPLRLSIKKIILIGDHKQLPQVMFSKNCVKSGYNRSMFERFIDNNYKYDRLNVQYRMDKKISDFISEVFYDNELKTADSLISNYPKDEIFTIIKYDKNFYFIDVKQGNDNINLDSKSFYNTEELKLIAELIFKLTNCINDKLFYEKHTFLIDKNVNDINRFYEFQISIICPYKEQTEKIKNYLLHDSVGRNDTYFSRIKINTIDSFQGGEADIVILSTVRAQIIGYDQFDNDDIYTYINSPKGNNKNKEKYNAYINKANIGFLKNYRRLNVAISRAKYCCIVLGSEETLKCDPYWNKLIEYCTNLNNKFVYISGADNGRLFAEIFQEKVLIKKEQYRYYNSLKIN